MIRLIILARILSPDDFGLMGIALLTMSALETFSETGFQAALIQKKEDIISHLDSAWTVMILRGIVLFSILYLIAPYAATFFNMPQAKPIIQVTGLSVLLHAFTNIGVIYFQKDLEFNKEFLYQFAVTLADFVIAVLAVLILRNVWALVFGLLAGNITSCFVSYLIHPYRPHLSSDLRKAKDLFGYGKWILASSILIFLITQGDDIFVGKLLGTIALGFYQMAYKISNMPATEISHVISRVSFPAYSKLQDNLPKLKEAYLRIIKLTAFISIPLAGGIFILAPEFTTIFLGEKWMSMVPVMQVLVIYGAARSIGATNGSLFKGSGNPIFDTKVVIIKIIFLVLIIYPLTKQWGITGTALATTLPVIFSQAYGISRVLRILQCTLTEFLVPIMLPFIGTVLMLIPLYIIKQIPHSILVFIISIPVGISIYISFWLSIGKYYEKHNILKMCVNMVKSIKD